MAASVLLILLAGPAWVDRIETNDEKTYEGVVMSEEGRYIRMFTLDERFVLVDTDRIVDRKSRDDEELRETLRWASSIASERDRLRKKVEKLEAAKVELERELEEAKKPNMAGGGPNIGPAPRVVIVSKDVVLSGAIFKMDGMIQNQGKKKAIWVEITVFFYDEQDILLSKEAQEILASGEILEPNEGDTFLFTCALPKGTRTYKIIASAR